MQINEFAHLLQQNFPFEPTSGQEEVISKLADFIFSNNPYPLFILNGFAGTGKTSLLNSLVNSLQQTRFQTVLLAPTGRAAKVLSKYTGKPAFTLHKYLYYFSNNEFGNFIFQLKQNRSTNVVYIIDEASLLSYSNNYEHAKQQLLSDLVYYVFSQNESKLIFVGDTCQLPPINHNISPAMDSKIMESIFSLSVVQAMLSEVVRQAQDSGILKLATFIRHKIEDNNSEKPYLNVDFSKKDIFNTDAYNIIEHLENAYSQYGNQEVVFITISNKRANQYNKMIRQRIFYQENELNAGDLLMVVKNNYYWLPKTEQTGFIANGEIAELQSIRNIEEIEGFRFADATIFFKNLENPMTLDVKIMLDTLWTEEAGLPDDKRKQLYNFVLEKYKDIPTKRERNSCVRNDEYYNALQVKLAYALTCHKTQGGQWDAVFVENPFYSEEMQTIENLRWLYTAVTRATKQLFLVNFDESFYTN